jgi:hypothetical protein
MPATFYHTTCRHIPEYDNLKNQSHQNKQVTQLCWNKPGKGQENKFACSLPQYSDLTN